MALVVVYSSVTIQFEFECIIRKNDEPTNNLTRVTYNCKGLWQLKRFHSKYEEQPWDLSHRSLTLQGTQARGDCCKFMSNGMHFEHFEYMVDLISRAQDKQTYK